MAPDTTNAEYVIWSIEHEAWWRPAWLGYTTSLLEAGRYSFAESAKILQRANFVEVQECRIPVAALGNVGELLASCQRVVRLLEQKEGVDAVADSALNQVRAAITEAEGR